MLIGGGKEGGRHVNDSNAPIRRGCILYLKREKKKSCWKRGKNAVDTLVVHGECQGTLAGIKTKRGLERALQQHFLSAVTTISQEITLTSYTDVIIYGTCVLYYF